MTKTPYEVRLDLLNMATSQLSSEYYAALERARDIQEPIIREAAIQSLQYPTKTDIVKLAEEYKDFIDTK
jgi:hypothetical protein